jgi:ATP synthase protein I
MDSKHPKNESKEDRRPSFNALARYSGMGFQIGGTIIVCLFIGKWLDGRFKPSFPVFTTSLTILGVFIGLYFVFKEILKKK